MNFPKDYQGIGKVIRARRRSEARIRKAIQVLTVKKGQVRQICEALNGLLDSWADPYPGLLGPAYFLLSSGLERIVVFEFLSSGTLICATREEWDNYLKSRKSTTDRYDRVPFFLRLMNFAHAKKGKCSSCRQMVPVVERYETQNPAVEARGQFFLLCLNCNLLAPIESKVGPKPK